MPIRSAAFTVTGTAVALASNNDIRPSPQITVQNLGGAGGFLYLGDASVTSAVGLAVASNVTLTVNTAGGPLYGISGAGGVSVRIIEEY